MAAGAPAKSAANWLMGEVSKRLNAAGTTIESAPLAAATLGRLLARIADGTLSNNGARQVFDALWKAGSANDGPGADEVDALIESMGLKQSGDSGELDAIVEQVLAANARSVEEFRAGKEKAFNALVGQAMKASKGKADPGRVGELLRKKLAG